MSSTKMVDFGKFIPGAKKHLYEQIKSIRTVNDIVALTKEEQSKVSRDLILPYNAEEDLNAGTDRNLVWLREQIVKSVPAKIKKGATQSSLFNYIQYCRLLNDYLDKDMDFDYLHTFIDQFLFSCGHAYQPKLNVPHYSTKCLENLLHLFQRYANNPDAIAKARLKTNKFLNPEEEVLHYLNQRFEIIPISYAYGNYYLYNNRLYSNNSTYALPISQLNDQEFNQSGRITKGYLISPLRKPVDPLDTEPVTLIKGQYFPDKQSAVSFLMEKGASSFSIYQQNLQASLLEQQKEKKKRRSSSSKPKEKTESLPAKTFERNMSEQEFLTRYAIEGVQFGNYVTQPMRIEKFNYTDDALHTLAQLLGISTRSMGFHNQLSLAIGARGFGKFAAHYEPGQRVINLTRDNGAGSLCHEWMHAFDHMMSRHLHLPSPFTTENFSSVMPKEFLEFHQAIRYQKTPNGRILTEMFKNSRKAGDYYRQDVELFARACESVIALKMKQQKLSCPFLIRSPFNGVYPTEEHAKLLEPLFDQMIQLALQNGLFNSPEQEEDPLQPSIPDPTPNKKQLKQLPASPSTRPSAPIPTRNSSLHFYQPTLDEISSFTGRLF